MAIRMGGVRPMPRRRPQPEPYDTAGMDPEMAKTLSEESGRRQQARQMYSPIAEGAQKVGKTFNLGAWLKSLTRGREEVSVLKLYGFIPRKHTASWAYRIQTPFETARDLGLPVQCRIDTDDAGISPQQHIEGFAGSDVTLLYQPLGEEAIKQVQAAKTILPSKMEDGAWKHPPAIVIESDDNLFNVNPHNSAFRTLGIRDPNGKDLEPGMLVGSIDDGVKTVLWKDGEDGFDIRRNHQNLNTYRALLEMADAFTCTSPHIVQAVEKEVIPQRTKVFPNLVRMDHYEQLDLVPDPSVVKILWQGGGSHGEDFYPLRKAFGELTKKYPQIHWIIWGAMYHWALEEIPPDRFTHHRWCPYQEYRLRRVMFGEDISIAPLTDNSFNRCRSAIKWYEASVLKHPAATVAQSTGPYMDEIQHGETGLLFDSPAEFVEQVSRVVEDVTLRKTLGANAKDWVNENRNAWKEVPRWVQWLEQLREETIRETPHMPDSNWEAFVKSQLEAVEAYMALFTPSTIAVSAAVQQIAAAAGASGDPEQRELAGVSLNAAIKHFNNRANWDFAAVEAPPVTVFAPFGFTVVSASAGQTSALVATGHGLTADDSLAGQMFSAGVRVTATAAGSVGFNYAFNSSLGSGIQAFSATATRDLYDLPSDWKAEYSVRLLGSQRVLLAARQRQIGRAVSNEMLASTPERYDVFPIGAKGKIRLFHPPAFADVLQLRYYRRMTVASATAMTATLDIPQDYDDYLIAWGKWHYLLDKSNEQSNQAGTWLTHAEKGLEVMLADQTRRPDEDLMFFPGASMGGVFGPNSTRNIDWEY